MVMTHNITFTLEQNAKRYGPDLSEKKKRSENLKYTFNITSYHDEHKYRSKAESTLAVSSLFVRSDFLWLSFD